jgi:signal peptidase I
MFTSFADGLLESLSDISQNPIALVIFSIIALLIFLLVLAIMFPFWRRALVSARVLEEREKPVSLLVWIISIVIIVKLVQIFIVQPFIVDGGSMLPTFHNKEFLIVDKFSYQIGEPHRGDVAIFKLYQDRNNPYNGRHLIKRVIGLPGEHIVIRNGTTYIYNKENPDGFQLDEEYVLYKDMSKGADVVLGEDEYFMMGDNRAQSYDSRDWGVLDRKNIKGQVLFRVYPFGVAGYEPGQYLYTN